MNNLIKIGVFVNTHGLKGEIRLLSKYDYQAELQINNALFIDKKKFTIRSTRKHKNFTLITFKEINNINDIEHLKGKDIYAEKISEDIEVPEYIGYDVFQKEKKIGKVIDFIEQGSIYSLVVEKIEGGINYLPMVEQFIDLIENDKLHIREITL